MKQLKLVGMLLGMGMLISSVSVLGASKADGTRLVQMTSEAEKLQTKKQSRAVEKQKAMRKE